MRSSIPGSGRPPGGGGVSPLRCACRAIAWTQAPGGLQSMGFQRSGTLRVTGTHEARAGVGCSTAPACGPRLEETSPVQKQQSPTLGLGNCSSSSRSLTRRERVLRVLLSVK